MKTYICTSKSDGKVYVCNAEDKADLLDSYDISEDYFDIVEKEAAWKDFNVAKNKYRII